MDGVQYLLGFVPALQFLLSQILFFNCDCKLRSLMCIHLQKDHLCMLNILQSVFVLWQILKTLDVKMSVFQVLKLVTKRKKMHTHTHTHSHTCMHTHTHTLSLSHTHTHTLTLSLSFSHTYTHTHTCTHSLSLSHTHTHIHTHTHTCKHADKQRQVFTPPLTFSRRTRPSDRIAADSILTVAGVRTASLRSEPECITSWRNKFWQ